ncbi:hypothetical protein PVK06_018918 [Gossypium arboreum]|uniref:RNase H type-1 domain-containing protein n=1 Tax=Gossypium arboreum TaxID=29729 RepID=A0ABR0PIJ8_GOSAR|nr:hypothetical protein PVK06_018918 [Gossypium arboreum]
MGQRFQQWSRLRSREEKAFILDLEERLQELYGRDPSNKVLAKITEEEISSCHTNPKSFPISTRNQLWRPPNSGTSFLKESRISFAVILARNNEGQFFGACTYPFGDVVDAVVAETRTCKRAMLFAADLGWKRILLEGDSLTTIKKLNSKEEDRSILRPIINNIRVLRKKFENVSYLLVPRVVNSTAHTLRAFGLKNYRNQFGKLWRKIWKPRFREVEGLGIL